MVHSITREIGLQLYDSMVGIRMVEQAIADAYSEQEIRCPVHLSIGQEGPAGAFSLACEIGDLAVSSHRGHAHYLAKGGNLDRLIAELYGKATGCSAGLGGSMHLIDTNVGFMGTSAIVGNSIPVGVGLGLALRNQRISQAACVFFGDGATEEGAFYESLNIAALLKLPVLFFCENNAYSVYTQLHERQAAGRSLVSIAQSMGVRATSVDGNSPLDCYEVLTGELARIRADGGPALIEFATFRILEHCGPGEDDHLGYRREGELASWLDRDPILSLRESIKVTDVEDDAVVRAWSDRIEHAFDFAKSSPFPAVSDLEGKLYAE